ncbi:hypothetical protein BWI15_32720 [Kribbella sp. ALI-6-A]|uniref:hypothetical protein n=1 Tax=Kribbella sp. ALI-6-A TaxID=1933817 RepID=UPI00097C365E|nr:hypothetical protein [Kribbella sp. ALI-6-A]ONI67840.1 hypothetical protein BWI15_32720 [Kribbella sp. ALI-6-A]
MSYPPPPPPLHYTPYGGPPKKNRAGLIIALLIGVVVACVGAAGYIAYDLVSDRGNAPKATERTDGMPVSTPSAKPTPVKPKPTATKPVAKPTARPTARPTAKPTTARPPAPVTKPAQAAALTKTFVAHLNANRPAAAGALACVDTKTFVPSLIGRMIGPPSHLVVARQSGSEPTLVYHLSGTTKGKQAFGVVLVDTSAAPCVRVINVGTS